MTSARRASARAMADKKSCGGDRHEFVVPTAWSTVGHGVLRARMAQKAKADCVFFFKGAVKEAPAGRGRPKRRAQALSTAAATRARTTAQQHQLQPDLVSAAVVASAKLTELIKAHKEDFVCCVCMENAIQVRFEPCKHSATCDKCASRLGQYANCARRCPLCRADIKHVTDLATGKRVKAEPFGTFPKACHEVLAQRRLVSARAHRPAADAAAQ